MTTVEIWGARAGQTQSRLFEEIRKCREAGQRVLLLVPEQYTLQAERELVEQLNLPGLLDLDVLSPRRFQFTPLREGRRQKICNFCKSFVQPLQISMA